MMNRKDQRSDSIATEAADWYARLRAPDVSELERVRFRAWLASDPARRYEFEAVDSFWGGLSAIEGSPEVADVRASLPSSHRRGRSKPHRVAFAIAATLVLALTGAWLTWHEWSAGRYTTQGGQMRVVRLPDGSVVTLNAATEIKLRYSQGRRGVELMQGEANFKVAKDASRPFIVMAGAGQVEALGTMFDVYESTRKITVTLIEGTVAVTPNAKASPTNGGDKSITRAIQSGSAKTPDDSVIVLTAGEQLSYVTMPAALASHLPSRGPEIVRWENRKLDFSNTPLLEAIAQANRYSPEQLVLEAPGLENARISGIFTVGRNDLFAEGLRTYFHLETVRTGEHTIILQAPPK